MPWLSVAEQFTVVSPSGKVSPEFASQVSATLPRLLHERLDAMGPAPRAELLHVLTLPDFDRVGRIGEFYGNPKTRTFAELLVDAEEDPNVRAVLVGLLREAQR